MKRATTLSRIVLGIALALAFVPSVAFAATLQPTSLGVMQLGDAGADGGQAADPVAEVSNGQDAGPSASAQAADGQDADPATEVSDGFRGFSAQLGVTLSEAAVCLGQAKASLYSMTLPYDPALIAQIGTQEQTGHTICCPSFSCAYADAVMDGNVHSHEYYTCSQCSWTDWGGGDSAFRCVGSDEQLLREAYDQISAGKPTVIHVAASYGEHWIALIGYENAVDPDHLSLSNFVALDPWNGAQVNAGASFTLYGDGCEHVSER